MSALDCTALEDGERCRTMVEEGEYCPKCAAWHEAEAAYWAREYRRSPEVRSQEDIDQDLRDAGRGHLVSDQAWSLFQRSSGNRGKNDRAP